MVAVSGSELVNPVPREAIPGWARAMATTFLRHPRNDAAERRISMLHREWEAERAWGVRDGDRWVATLRTESRSLTVPGPGHGTREIPADALTNVTVAATHRRQGLMSRMLTGSLRAARERRDPISILIAAEWPIYGRFGYAPAALSADYELRTSRPGALCPGDPSRLRQVDPTEVALVAPAVFDAARRERAGQIDRSARWWNRVLGQDGYAPMEGLPHNWLVHDGDDGPDGLVAWTARGDSGLVPPLGRIDVWDLVSANDTAYRNLWAYLSGIDGVDAVALDDRPVDEPVRWLLADGRALVMTQQVDLLWLRLLDVAAALSARRYATAGEVVLDVVDDDLGPSVAGRYRLHADGDAAECTATDAAPDLRITQRALASIYLGGVRLRQLLLAGAASELTAGAIDRVDLMFTTPLAPWNATWF